MSHRLRIVVDGTSPPLWRRVEVASTLGLDQLHEVVQVAFGWTDRHLHRFISVPAHDGSSESYLCPFDVAEREAGIPEEQVALGDVLVEVGDQLQYWYDYGDDWWHTLELEAVLPRDRQGQPLAICTDGDRPGPPEDCGGVCGYERLMAARDPDHPTHAESAVEFAEVWGDEVDPADIVPTPFDVTTINLDLATVGAVTALDMGAANDPVADLLARAHDPMVRRRLRRFVADAALDQSSLVSVDTAARMVAPYRWMLDRIGDDGITLTAAGYPPPGHVTAAMADLGLREEWIGRGNRESDTLPVLHLRETSQKLGLVRKYHGRLLVTARGREAVDDPIALWRHLAQRMPLGSRDESERQVGMVLLLSVAVGSAEGVDGLAAATLTATGWVEQDGAPIRPRTAQQILWDNLMLLRRIGAITSPRHDPWPGRATSDGIAFARMALTSWPTR